jgi:hypothetical protein
VDRERVREALDAIADREAPSGPGVITGKVRTEDGKPVEGAEVVLTPEPPRVPRPQPRPGERPPDPDLVDVVVERVRQQRWWIRTRKIALTDAAGEVRFEGLADVRHRLAVYRRGLQFRPTDWRAAQEARPGALVEWIASPSAVVKCGMTLPDGSVPDRGQVTFTAGNSSTGTGWTPDYPYATLRPGSYEAVASSGDGQEFKSDPQSVEVREGEENPVLAFALKGRPLLRGRVTFPDGEASDGVVVHLQRLAADQKPTPESVRAAGKNAWVPGSGDSRFSFPDLAPGRYALGLARGHNGPVVAVEEAEVGDGPAEKDLRMPSPDPSEYVVVRALGPDGRPLADLQVQTGYSSKNRSRSGGSATIRRPDGTLWAFHQPQESGEDPEGKYWVTVQSRSHGTKRAEYRKGEQDEVTLRFEEPARLEVRVTGAKGTPYEGSLSFSLQATGEDRRFADGSRPPSGADGVQVFAAVQPGDYVLLLTLQSDRRQVPLSRTPVTLRAGKNEVAVPLPPLHSVTVTGAEGQVLVQSTGEERFSVYQPTTEGKALFDGLPEGEYTVRSGQKSQTFRVPGTTSVNLGP